MVIIKVHGLLIDNRVGKVVNQCYFSMKGKLRKNYGNRYRTLSEFDNFQKLR